MPVKQMLVAVNEGLGFGLIAIVALITILNVILGVVHFSLVLAYTGRPRSNSMSRRARLSADRSVLLDDQSMMPFMPDEDEDPRFGYVTMPRDGSKKTYGKMVLISPSKSRCVHWYH
ncbi:hypothetical protein OSTOST_19734 [Ostertagia ostertagi]